MTKKNNSYSVVSGGQQDAERSLLEYLIGTMKANCANIAMKRKIISGLLSVTRNAVTALCVSVPFLLLLL